MQFEDRDYIAPLESSLSNNARLLVCSNAKDMKDAEMLLEMLGLLSDTRASDSDSINDPVTTPERSN